MLDTVDEEDEHGEKVDVVIDDSEKVEQEEIPEPDMPSGEGRPPKMARNPKQPSRADVIKHRLCHIPIQKLVQSMCARSGKGQSAPFHPRRRLGHCSKNWYRLCFHDSKRCVCHRR